MEYYTDQYGDNMRGGENGRKEEREREREGKSNVTSRWQEGKNEEKKQYLIQVSFSIKLK